MSKKEKRQNLKVIQHDLVKKVFVRYPGLSLVSFQLRCLYKYYTKVLVNSCGVKMVAKSQDIEEIKIHIKILSDNCLKKMEETYGSE